MNRTLIILAVFFPLLYLGVWIHELGHAVACVAVGGNVTNIIAYDCFTGATFCEYPSEFSLIVKYSGGLIQGIFFVLVAEKIHPAFYLAAVGALLYALVEGFLLYDTVLYLTSSLFQFVALAIIIVTLSVRILDRKEST